MCFKEYLLGIIIALFTITGILYLHTHSYTSIDNKPIKIINRSVQSDFSMTVKVIGAVKNPGIVTIKSFPPRLIDAIKAAGGLTGNPNFSAINLAENIQYATLISIPFSFQDKVIIIKNLPDKKHKKKKRKKKHRKFKKKKHKKVRLNVERYMAGQYYELTREDRTIENFDNMINSELRNIKINSKIMKALSMIPDKQSNDQELDTNSTTISDVTHSTTGKKVLPEINSIELNTATKYELMALPGIGEKTADNIIQFRKLSIIRTSEDILKIKGIGPKKLEKILPYLKFSETNEAVTNDNISNTD